MKLPIPLLASLCCLPLLGVAAEVSLSVSANPSVLGAPVVLSANVTPANVTGRVTFYDGTTVLGIRPVLAGSASLSTLALPAGSRKLKAYYSGDTSTAAASSNIVTQLVQAQPSAGLSLRTPLATPVSKVFAAADFNGDSRLDLLVSRGQSATISILLGTGNGLFATPGIDVSIGGNGPPEAAATGDFNNDGRLDVAVAISASSSIYILLGDGLGGLTAPVTYFVANAGAVAVADCNGDGNADLVTSSAGQIGVLLGRGDGTFQTLDAAYVSNSQVSLADFDNDGKVDLIASGLGAGRFQQGRGDGTFAPPGASFAVPNVAAIGDFNGDLIPDLATFEGSSRPYLGILFGSGTGAFQDRVSYPAGTHAGIASVGDVNGDGKVDLILSGDGVTLVYGNGDGSFRAPVTISRSQQPAFAADINGDGKTDLILGDGSLLVGTTISVTATLGNPQSTLNGTAFPLPLEVRVADGTTPVGGAAVTFATPDTGPSANLSSSLGTTDASGSLSTTVTAKSGAGSYQVMATALGVSAAFNLVNLAAAPSVFSPSPAVPQSALLNTAFAQPLQVRVTDAQSNPAAGVTVTFAVPASGPSAALSSVTAVTDADGFATVMATANSTPGNYVVVATSGTLSTSFSMTNLQVTSLILSTSANPSTFGAPLNVTLSISPAGSGGSVTFYDGVKPLGTKPVVSGVASLSTIMLPAGVSKLRARFSGTDYLAGGVSNTVLQTVRAVGGVGFVSQAAPNLALPQQIDYVFYKVTVADFNNDGKADVASVGASGWPAEWWQVDLGTSVSAGSIVIWNRTDCCAERLSDYWVFLSDTPFSATDTTASLQNRAGTWTSHQTVVPSPSATIGAAGAQGRYLRVQLTGSGYLSLAEVQVFGPGGGANLARGKAATQSSTLAGYSNAGAGTVVDGDTNGGFFNGSVSHTSSDKNTIKLSLGRGDGTFEAPVRYSGPEGSTSIATGDFNGDGNADLAVSGSTTYGFPFLSSFPVPRADIAILLGNGDGTFRPAAMFPGAVQGGQLAISDLNNDGRADILIAYRYQSGVHSFNGGLTVLFGNGDGTFRAPVAFSSEGISVAVSDFNNDDNADVIAGSGSSISPCPSGFYVIAGNGDGSAQHPINLPFLGCSAPVIADLNGDGRSDLVTSGSTTLLGNGDGTFQSPVSYAAGPAVAAGDFNGDGIVDLAALSSSVTGISILLGNGNGTVSVEPTDKDGTPLVIADFNGDGRADILTYDFSNRLASILVGTDTRAPQVTVTAGTPQTTPTGTSFAVPLQVLVKNNGAPLSGATVVFSAPAAGASAALSSLTAVTNGSGIALVTAVANSVGGSYLVTASYGGASASFSLTNTRVGSLVASGGTPQVAFVNTAFLDPLQVTVKDGFGNPLSGVTVTFDRTGASVSLSAASAVTNAFGVASVTAQANGAAGSYVVLARIESFSVGFALSIVAPGGTNLALGRTATQSTTLSGYPGTGAASVVDGNTDGNFFHGSVSHTNLEANPWWQVDLGVSASVSDIIIWNRTDCCSSRLRDYWVFLSDTPFAATDTPLSLQNRPGTFAVHQTGPSGPWTGMQAGGAQGRYLRIQLSVTDNLSLAEVQVFGTPGTPVPGSNLAAGKPASQSSTLAGSASAGAASAVDNNKDGNFFHNSVTHTETQAYPWWQVDLGASATITSIVIANRTDCCGDRLNDYWVFVSDAPFGAADTPAVLSVRAGTWATHLAVASTLNTIAAGGVQGRYVRIQLATTNALSLAEVEVFGTAGTPSLGSNLAIGKAASQSSTLTEYTSAGAASAIDNNQDGNFFHNSVTHTREEANPWWQVDLGSSATVNTVVISNRTDCCVDRLGDYWVFVSNTPFGPADTPAALAVRAGTWSVHMMGAPNPSVTLPTGGVAGRYVRVQLGNINALSLAEVQVIGTGGSASSSNLAQGKPATQSTTLSGYATTGAAGAVDGVTNGNFFAGSVTHTDSDLNAWWQVDLGASAMIDSLVIWNRTDCCGTRLSDYWVFVSDTPFGAADTPATLQGRAGTWSSHQTAAPDPSTAISTGSAHGRYVRVQLNGAGPLSLAEVQVFGAAGTIP